MYDLFVCHSSKDKPFVNWLARELGKHGIATWVDVGELKVGDSLIEKIEEGISKTNYFGVVLSNNSIESNWVKRELQMAFTREFEEKRPFILPILIEDCKPPLYVREKKYADFRKEAPEGKGVRDLLQVLVGMGHFQVMLFRQKWAAIPRSGYRQRITIENHSNIAYQNEKVPVIVAKHIEPNKAYFSLNIINLTSQLKENIKVSVKPEDSSKRILECEETSNARIISGGKTLNFVSYNVNLIHPRDEAHLGLALNTDEWPDVKIVGENCIWGGELFKMDVVPGEYEKIDAMPVFRKRK